MTSTSDLRALTDDLLALCKEMRDWLQPEVVKEPDRTFFWKLVDAINATERLKASMADSETAPGVRGRLQAPPGWIERLCRLIHEHVADSPPDQLIHQPWQNSWEEPTRPRWTQWLELSEAIVALETAGVDGAKPLSDQGVILRSIAKQRLSTELDEHEHGSADWEDGYDQLILLARRASDPNPLPDQPVRGLGEELATLSKKASINGPLRYTNHERKDDRGHASWSEVECLSKEKSWHVCQCPDEEDAAFIVAAVNHVRAQLDASTPQDGPDQPSRGLACMLCGRKNGDPRPWDTRSSICPDCEDKQAREEPINPSDMRVEEIARLRAALLAIAQGDQVAFGKVWNAKLSCWVSVRDFASATLIGAHHV
jgi:hypothetical protein